jgi:hypothetical protein
MRDLRRRWLPVASPRGNWRRSGFGVRGELVALRVQARKWNQRMRGRVGKARSREGAAIGAKPRRDLELRLPAMAEPASNCHCLAAQ